MVISIKELDILAKNGTERKLPELGSQRGSGGGKEVVLECDSKR
jgi:hypothetical protein